MDPQMDHLILILLVIMNLLKTVIMEISTLDLRLISC